MGGKLSKNPKRHQSNRVFVSSETSDSSKAFKQSAKNPNILEPFNELEEIRVPDKTSKHKSKSRSLFTGHFTKKSSIRKTSSLQSAVQLQNLSKTTLLEKLQTENDELKKEIEKLKQQNLDQRNQHNSEITRLKAEMKALNIGLNKVRAIGDQAKLTEKDAVERANNIEQGKITLISFICCKIHTLTYYVV